MARVAVAMSGGVDSSAAALILKNQGYQLEGVTFRLFGEGESAAERDAARVSAALGIPHRVADYRGVFEARVMRPFAQAYQRGVTPNPCILCNRGVKFGRFFDDMEREGFDFVATGHYARIAKKNGSFFVRKAANLKKDQSYVLYALSQRQLAHVLLPIGELDFEKEKVRQLLREAGLPVAERPDSQDICFIPDGDHGAFIERYLGLPRLDGDFVTQDGRKAGIHHGVFRYTIGQRKGLGVSLGRPAFVSAVDPGKNRVVLTTDERELFARSLRAGDLCWAAGQWTEGPLTVTAKLRYAHPGALAVLEPLDGSKARVTFEEAQRAPTPGQAVVFYRDDLVLGGAEIEEVEG